jgi:hypothetical protein
MPNPLIQANKYIVGKVITRIRYTTPEENEAFMWGNSGPVIELNDGTKLYCQSDDEGNEPGALHTNLRGLPTIPSL